MTRPAHVDPRHLLAAAALVLAPIALWGGWRYAHPRSDDLIEVSPAAAETGPQHLAGLVRAAPARDAMWGDGAHTTS